VISLPARIKSSGLNVHQCCVSNFNLNGHAQKSPPNCEVDHLKRAVTLKKVLDFTERYEEESDGDGGLVDQWWWVLEKKKKQGHAARDLTVCLGTVFAAVLFPATFR